MSRHRALLIFALLLLPSLAAPAVMDRSKLRWLRNEPPPVISEIEIDGNSYFSDSDIRDRMYSHLRTGWAALKGDRRSRVQRETYGRDTLEIRFMYLSKGFLGVKVDEEFEIMEPDSSARVHVMIDEGRQFVYGDRSIVGTYEKALARKFEKISNRFKRGKPVNYYEVMRAGFDMKTVLANNGYPYATVAPIFDTTLTTQLTPIEFRIRSDSVVHFGDVTIVGTNQYPAYTARRELKIKPGELYRRSTIIDSQRRLFESGYFSTLNLQQANSNGNRYTPDFILNVRERKPYYVTLTTGAGQSQAADLTWSFTAGTGTQKLFGSRRLDFYSRVEFSLGSYSRVTDHRYRLRFTEPWFLGIRMPLSLTGEFQPRRRHETQDFDVQQWSVSLSTEKRFGRYTEGTAGLEYQSVDIAGVPKDIAETIRRQVEGLSIRRRLYANVLRDSRDLIFTPHSGSVRELMVDYYGGFLGGDDNFWKVIGSWSTYNQVWPGWIAASRLKVGYAHAFDGSSIVPSKDRLFLGGANSIRGFPENSIAPVLADELPGANVILLANQEFRWKTLQIFQVVPLLKKLFENLPLWQSIFFDMGNGYVQFSDARIDNLAMSYGTGVQIISPAGPVRVDYARRIPTKYIGFDDRWHFTILWAF